MSQTESAVLLEEADFADNDFCKRQADTATELLAELRDDPLVSVIIPAYNAEAYILDTLNSVLSQTYKNIEVLVVDDGSRDRTTEIVQAVIEKDDRVFLFRQPNSGVAAARNLAIEKSKGEFIAPVDADDIWFPEKLEKQIQRFLESDRSVGLVYAWSADIDEEGRITGRIHHYSLEGNVYTALVHGNFLGNASVPLIRRSCLDKVGYYNCQFVKENAQGCEDTDLYLRVAEYYQFRVVPEFLVGYRKVLSSMSNNYETMEKSHNLVLEEVQKRHPDIPAAFYKWSKGNFYLYLSTQSRRSGNHKSALFWIYKAVKNDPLNFLNFELYTFFFKSLFKWLLQPATSLLWSDQRSWLKFRRRVKTKVKSNLKLTISDLQERVEQSKDPPKNLYRKIQTQRWLQVTQDCQYKNC